MEIAYAQPLPCGNATRILLNPGQGEVEWRVLRRMDDAFTGPGDTGALRIHDGSSRYVPDFTGLVNGVTYFYAVYPRDAAGVYGPPAFTQLMPTLDFTDVSVDVQEVVRERLDLTLNNLIAQNRLPISKPFIDVLSIPFYLQDTPIPVVTVLLGVDGSSVRAIGDDIADEVVGDDGFIGTDGWLSAVELDISVWSQNGEERNLLRKALKAAVIANFPAFEEAGMTEINFRMRDDEDQQMDTTMFRTLATLTCQAGSAVASQAGRIETILSIRE